MRKLQQQLNGVFYQLGKDVGSIDQRLANIEKHLENMGKSSYFLSGITSDNKEVVGVENVSTAENLDRMDGQSVTPVESTAVENVAEFDPFEGSDSFRDVMNKVRMHKPYQNMVGNINPPHKFDREVRFDTSDNGEFVFVWSDEEYKYQGNRRDKADFVNVIADILTEAQRLGWASFAVGP